MSRQSLVPINLPALPTAPSIPTPKAGDMYFNTSDLGTYVFNGTAWAATGGGGSSGGGVGTNLAWWFGV